MPILVYVLKEVQKVNPYELLMKYPLANLFRRVHALWNPECYHGWGKSKRFFEGWYYKLVSQDQDFAFAIIPGIAMNENGNQQAFIQVLDGKKHRANYYKFDVKEFVPSSNKHALYIGENFFSSNKISLNLPDIKGEIYFDQVSPWSTSLLSPGIMGPYSFIPFMECYHGILSMDHELKGEFLLKNDLISFDGGRGYTEKDWGHSFPEGYLWMQSNHFANPGISIKASVAKIPWLFNAFNGFIAGVLFNERLYEFTTYNGSYLRSCKVTEKQVRLCLENKHYRLDINAIRERATELAAPIAGFMDARIEESMNAQITLELFDKKNKKILLNDTGYSAGIEVAGNYHLLLT